MEFENSPRRHLNLVGFMPTRAAQRSKNMGYKSVVISFADGGGMTTYLDESHNRAITIAPPRMVAKIVISDPPPDDEGLKAFIESLI
jgi:hypothetical protein